MTIRPATGGSEGGEPPAGGTTRPDVAHAEPDELIDPGLDDSVADALLGDAVADIDEAQPDRKLCSTSDFASIYIRSRHSLEHRARSFLSDPRDVEEVVQETFLRLVLAMPELEYEWQAHAFCRRVLTNLCIDRYRRDRRRPQLYDLDSGNVIDIAGEEFTDHPVLRAEDAAVVREALARLTPLHRAALVKREIEEKPLAVIATELDVPEDSVKHVLFRARRSLRRRLAGTPVDPEADIAVDEGGTPANRRLARATLRSANGLIALVTTALVVAVGAHGLMPKHTTEQQANRERPRAADGVPHPDPAAGSTGDQRHASHPAAPTSRTPTGRGGPAAAGPPLTSGSQPAHHAAGSTVTSPPSHSGSGGPVTGPAPSPPSRPGHGGGTTPPSTSPTSAPAPYTITLDKKAYVAAPSNESSLDGTNTRTTSQLVVASATAAGDSYTVTQQLLTRPTTADPAILNGNVSLSLAFPVGAGSTGTTNYAITDPQMSENTASDGAVTVTMTGMATAAGDPPTGAPGVVQVALSATYAPGFATMDQASAELVPLGLNFAASTQPPAPSAPLQAAPAMGDAATRDQSKIDNVSDLSEWW